METVIVTYSDDMHRAVRAVDSITQFKIGNGPNTIYIVVNDCLEVFEQAQKLFQHCSEVRVHHFSDISSYMSARSGWWSQQWLKLAAHQLIKDEWYIPFDSDMFINRHVKNHEMFVNNKALCELRDVSIYQSNKKFAEYIKNAYDIWGIDNTSKILRESPPNILHRKTVDRMLTELSPHTFGNSGMLSLEFFVYWAYIVKQNLEHMYQHQDNWFWFGDAFHMDNS
jgi:hypothetical protein